MDIFRKKTKPLVSYDMASSSDTSPIKIFETVKLTKKRLKHLNKWKKNIRKAKVAKGESHISDKGKIIAAKTLKNSCLSTCSYNCTALLDKNARRDIFDTFYTLNSKEKRIFLLANTSRFAVKLEDKIKKNKNEDGNKKKKPKQYYYKYGLPYKEQVVQVCKPMFLNTLCINQSRVYNVHCNKIGELTPGEDGRGKNTRSKISIEDKLFLMDHINAYPRVESHYARAKTNKEYLDQFLDETIMYEHYVEKCKANNKEPLLLSYFRFIFDTEFNLAFDIPKTDRCFRCEKYKKAVKENIVTAKLESQYQEHLRMLKLMKAERDFDRQHAEIGSVVVAFDLENVIGLPKTDVGPAFYKRKINAYNLTGHAVQRSASGIRKERYCAVWSETMCGREGNDIASALFKILSRVIKDFKDVTYIITWSDACVPQNRNSIMSAAIGQFLNDFDCEKLIMKYSLPGHGCVQEIDNVHSQIEKHLRRTEIWSILGFIRLLLKVNLRTPFKVIQVNLKPQVFG